MLFRSNNALIADRRKNAIQQFDKHIKAVIQDLEKAEGDESLKAICLTPLESLRAEVERQESLAHISQAENEALKLKDAALVKIDECLAKKAAEKGKEASPPKIKHRRVVKPAELVKTDYLETQDEVNGFMDALHCELKDAISKDERIEIR